MIFDFTAFKTLYLAIGFAVWVFVMVLLWLRPNISNAELYQRWKQQNPNSTVSMTELLEFPDGPGLSSKWEAIGAFTFAFLSVLFLYLVYGCMCVRW